MKSVRYEEVNAEVYIEFRKWLIECGNHCGHLLYNGNSYRGTINFIQSFEKDNTKDKFLSGIEKLSQLVKEFS